MNSEIIGLRIYIVKWLSWNIYIVLFYFKYIVFFVIFYDYKELCLIWF